MKLAVNATFVLVDSGAGEDVTPEWIAKCAAAINEALQGTIKEHWGGDYHCRAGAVNPKIGPNEVKVSLEASSTIQGAAGYHTDDAIYCFRDGLPDLDGGAFAFSVIISHEIFETLGDPGANRWALATDGKLYAVELCDAVEGYCWPSPVNQVALSDFVLPSFFDPDASAPYSMQNKARAPFQTAADNGADYQIVMASGSEAQVTAIRGSWKRVLNRIDPWRRHEEILGARASAKAHPSSRTYRRLRARDVRS